MVLRKTLITAMLLSLSGASLAQNVSGNKGGFVQPTNGYTSIVVDTNYAQKHPLRTVLLFEYPANVKNVGQALNYILEHSGYSLAKLQETKAETLKLYSLPLPLIHRSFYSASIEQIASALIGSAYELNVDHVKREIAVIPNENLENSIERKKFR